MLLDIPSRHQGFMFSTLDDMLSPISEVRVIDLLIDRILENSGLDYSEGKGTSHTGRPAFPFSTMIRIFIYGYMNRITSSRRLEAECRRNIELMWLTGNMQPDYGTIAGFRANHGDEISRFSTEFKKFLKKMKLIGDTVAIDGTKIKANVNKSNMFTLQSLKSQSIKLEERINEYLDQISDADSKDEQVAKDLESAQTKLESVQSKIQDMENKNINSSSDIDADARFMRSKEGKIPAYNAQVGTDTESGFIVADTVTTNPVDSHELKTVAEEIEREINPDQMRLLADKGYYALDDIEEVESGGKYDCYVGVVATSAPLRDEFIYDALRDVYICPEGKVLPFHQKKKNENGTEIRVYRCKECVTCKRKQECSPNSKHGRMIKRRVNEEFRKTFKKKMESENGKNKMVERAKTVERVFGSIKIIAGKIPILSRGIKKVTTEIKLYCLAYNFRHFINMFEMNKIAAL
jgi:transposase